MKWARQRARQARLYAGAWLNMGSSDTAEIAGLAGHGWGLIELARGYRFIALGSDRRMVMQGMKANAEFFSTLATAA